MPLLKDYLGSLISGINQARAMADIESARIAEAYADNAILKTFSIPRFKASNIELDIPIAIDELDEVEETNYQPIDNNNFNSHAYNVFKDVLKVSRFDRKTSELLRKTIAKETDVLEKNLKAKEDTQSLVLKDYAQNLTHFFISDMQERDKKKAKELTGAVSNDEIPIENKLLRTLQDRLISKIKAPKKTIDMDNTKVLVQAHKLKEIPPESIVRIKMTLVEEGMEWHTIERDNGEIDQKLLPE